MFFWDWWRMTRSFGQLSTIYLDFWSAGSLAGTAGLLFPAWKPSGTWCGPRYQACPTTWPWHNSGVSLIVSSILSTKIIFTDPHTISHRFSLFFLEISFDLCQQLNSVITCLIDGLNQHQHLQIRNNDCWHWLTTCNSPDTDISSRSPLSWLFSFTIYL